MVDLAALFWVLFVFISSCHWNCRAILHGKLCDNVTSTRIHNLFVSVTIAPLLCAANHLPYVILSYISDPYHAGSVSMGYFLSLLLYYFVFARVYSRVVLRTGSRPKDFPYAVNADLVHFPDGDACRRKVRVPFNTQVVTLSLGGLQLELYYSHYNVLMLSVYCALLIKNPSIFGNIKLISLR